MPWAHRPPNAKRAPFPLEAQCSLAGARPEIWRERKEVALPLQACMPFQASAMHRLFGKPSPAWPSQACRTSPKDEPAADETCKWLAPILLLRLLTHLNRYALFPRGADTLTTWIGGMV